MKKIFTMEYYKANLIKIGLFSSLFSLFFGCYVIGLAFEYSVGWIILPLGCTMIAGMIFGLGTLFDGITNAKGK